MEVGRLLLVLGLLLVVLGLIWIYAPGLLAWFGRLPGDIRLEREGFRFYLPLTSMLLVSLLISLILRWLR